MSVFNVGDEVWSKINNTGKVVEVLDEGMARVIWDYDQDFPMWYSDYELAIRKKVEERD